jgi:hypothetical protein
MLVIEENARQQADSLLYLRSSSFSLLRTEIRNLRSDI